MRRKITVTSSLRTPWRSIGKWRLGPLFLSLETSWRWERVTSVPTYRLVKVLVQTVKAQRGEEVWLYFLFNFGAIWRCVVKATLQQLYPVGKRSFTLFPGGRRESVRGRFVQVWKISPLSRFKLRTVQPLVSRYSNYAIQTPLCPEMLCNLLL